MNKAQNSRLIKEEAARLGFSFCGIAKAEFLETEARQLESWLIRGLHGKMGYMENWFDLRTDPRKLVPGAKSVICLMYNYFPGADKNTPYDGQEFKISRYAWGADYHFILRKKINALLEFIRQEIGAVDGRGFVDSGPVLEKAWAQKSGLGWQGKHTNIIRKGAGSWFFLAELIVDLELDCDRPATDHCGSCTACIDACPTEAITPWQVDGSRCISYLTIELKEAIPPEFAGKMDQWIYGCDVCQEVCPWNRFSQPHKEPGFLPNEHLAALTNRDWQEITEETFKKVFSKSAIKRTKFAGLVRNVRFVGSGNGER